MAYDPDVDTTRYMKKDRGDFGDSASAITPNDSTDMATYPKAVMIAAAGDAVVLPARNADGATVTLTGMPAGYVIPFTVRRVLSTGTTATLVRIDSSD